MSNEILKSYGIENLDVAYVLIGMAVMAILILVLFILLIVQINKASKLKARLDVFLGGKDAKSLEKEIGRIFSDNEYLKTETEKNRKDIRRIFQNLEYTFQKCAIVKYDAFKQMGGNLSFSLVLLNKRNDGFIINSVHSSDGCYSYTKEIRDGKCDIALGEEEEKALNAAISLDE